MNFEFAYVHSIHKPKHVEIHKTHTDTLPASLGSIILEGCLFLFFTFLIFFYTLKNKTKQQISPHPTLDMNLSVQVQVAKHVQKESSSYI